LRFKLDENIGNAAAALLRDAGHDVSTVRDQRLSGARDERVFEVCASERRALVTLDHDFGQVLRFPPEHSAGIVILELAPRIRSRSVEERIRELILLLKERELGPELWIIEPGRARIHQRRE
jgi:predicted nuclease of predicted toxin-antitoxin system